MKRFARMLFAGLGIAIAGSAISLVPHKAATAGNGAPVVVTNTPLPVTQSGPWSVNANITNQLPLPVQGRVSVDNLPSTQSVNVANSPTVQLAPGTTVNTGGQDVLVLDQVLTLFGSTPVVDVSMYKQIRVVFIAQSGTQVNFSLGASLVDPNKAGLALPLDDLNASQAGQGTKTYELVPGIQVSLGPGMPAGPATVRVVIYGRTN